MFTTEHYRVIAGEIRAQVAALGVFTVRSEFAGTHDVLRELASGLADRFGEDNERFKRDVFIEACGFDPEPVLDFADRYSVDGYPGVAWRLIAYASELSHPECPGHPAEDVPNDGHAGIGDVVYCDGTCQPAEEEEVRSQVRAVMVGDDRQRVIDVSDLTKLDEGDYCDECGQIGCNGRSVAEIINDGKGK